MSNSSHAQTRDDSVIRSTAPKEMAVMLFFAFAWNAMSGVIAWNARPKLLADRIKLLWIGAFVLAGLWLLYLALKSYLRWRRFGSLRLTLDPYPVAVGGDVGGAVEISGLRAAYNTQFEVTLSCVRFTIPRSGKNRKRNERVEWRERGAVAGEPGVRGTRIRFRFAVPANLPATTPPSNDYYKWVVHVRAELPGADLDQTFEVPVGEAAVTPQRSRSGIDYTSTRVVSTAPSAVDEPAGATARVAYSSQGLRVFYPAARNRGMGVGLLAFGLLFGGVPVLLANQALLTSAHGGLALFALGTAGFVALIFGLFAVLMIVAGVYLLGNSLEVVVSARGVETVRRVFAIPMRRRYLARELVTGLQSRISGQTGQGAKARVSYTIKAAVRDRRPVTLGDGIKGVTEAKRVLAQLREHLGIKEEAAA